MKNKLLHILLSLSICLSIISCDMIFDGDRNVTESDLANVGFIISTGNTSDSSSRAATESGNGYENYLNIAAGDFRFLIFDSANRFLEAFSPDYVIPVDNSLYPEQYYVSGQLSRSYSDFKLVVLANWSIYPDNLIVGVSTIEDVCLAGVYDYAVSTTSFVPSAEKLIPMYGVKNFTGFRLNQGMMTDLGSVDLLRAMAKVVVTATDTELSEVRLNNYRAKGMCAPKGMYQSTTQAAASNLNVVSTEQVTSTSIPFYRLSDGSWVIYLPEYDNTLQGSVPATVDITIGTVTYSGAIKFGVYTDGSYTNTGFDILRNYCYKFNVVRVMDDIRLTYKVCDWDAVDIDIPPFE